MQNAGPILQAIRKLGDKRLPLRRVYRCLFSEDLFRAAYAKIYKNQGILTPGTENDTADDMSIERIRAIIAKLRTETFRCRPSRRINIPQKNGKGTRPLGLPNFTEKRVEEVLRRILEAYYEPRFRNCSHGCRPNRGCHTALQYLSDTFGGTTWFIEGDVKGCYDNISHDLLMSILAKDIQDGRFLNLIRMGIKAGIADAWEYKPTFSGTPQGGIVSPILATIYLNELDTYIEEVLIPQYTKGKRRDPNAEYATYTHRIETARKHGKHEEVRRLVQERRQYPVGDTHDPNYRRLKYLRYADDFILGFIGPTADAEAVKAQLTVFLGDNLSLELSAQKTLITHARTDHAKFLNYAVSIHQADQKLIPHGRTKTKTRSLNGKVRLGIPYGLVDENIKRYQQNNKIMSEGSMISLADANIIDLFQARFRGIAEYYKYATDRWRLGQLKSVMEVALVKTRAQKFRKKASKIDAKYRNVRTINNRNYKTLQVSVPTSTGERIIYWGALPLQTVKPSAEPIIDSPNRGQFANTRSALIRRLQANTCELWGSNEQIRVHHVRKLADLKKRGQGRREKPQWVKRMIALQRKTLIVCHKCHVDIHAGRPIPSQREEVLESRVI